jgi:hypothetical protein
MQRTGNRETEGAMKLVTRKTRKAIDKSVRKAMKKHGPALIAALASGLASSIATLAKTEAPGRHGKSHLAELAARAEESLSDTVPKKSRKRDPEKKRTGLSASQHEDRHSTM